MGLTKTFGIFAKFTKLHLKIVSRTHKTEFFLNLSTSVTLATAKTNSKHKGNRIKMF